MNSIEAAFLIAVVPGLLLVIRRFIQKMDDWKAQRRRQVNGARLLLARIFVYIYLAMFALFALITTLGVQLATAPNPANPARSTTVAFLVTYYMGLAIIASVTTWKADELTERLIDLLEQRALERLHQHDGL